MAAIDIRKVFCSIDQIVNDKANNRISFGAGYLGAIHRLERGWVSLTCGLHARSFTQRGFSIRSELGSRLSGLFYSTN